MDATIPGILPMFGNPANGVARHAGMECAVVFAGENIDEIAILLDHWMPAFADMTVEGAGSSPVS